MYSYVRFLTLFLWALTTTAMVDQSTPPLVLVWCLVQKTPQAPFDIDNHPLWASELEQLSEKWKLSLVMPVLDLEEINLLNPKEIATGQFASLKQIAERYGAKINWVIRLEQNNKEEWIAHEALLLENDQILWQQSAETEQIIVNDSLERIAKNLQKRETESSKKPQEPSFTPINKGNRIEVHSVQNLQEYISLLQYLNNSPAVAFVRIEQVQADRIIIQITPTSQSFDLNHALTSEGHLIKLNNNPENLRGTGISHYRWVPS